VLNLPMNASVGFGKYPKTHTGFIWVCRDRRLS
jgi:hypothetical protein